MSDNPAADDVRSSPASDLTNRGEFTVRFTEDAGETVGHVKGEMDMATCERLRDAIEPHLGPGQRLVLDLSGVTFMDSTCLNVLLNATTTLSADGGSLILRNPSDVASNLLVVAGITALLNIETSQQMDVFIPQLVPALVPDVGAMRGSNAALT